MKTNLFNAYIIGGGKSSRMGKDKATLQINKTIFYRHISQCIENFVPTIYFISSREEHKNAKNLIKDNYNNIGPIGGLHTALSNSDKEFNLISSCDIPMITKKTIEWLLRNFDTKYDAIITEVNDRINPLFGIYNSACLKTVQNQIDKEAYKMIDLCDNLKVKVVVAPTDIARSLTNVNTPTEYRNILKCK